MPKKTKKSPTKNRRVAFGAFIIIIALVAAFVLLMAVLPMVNNSVRKHRIVEIYNSLNLSDKYIIQDERVFGEKRVYEVDKSRSYSSSKEYLRAANVDTTMAELKNAATNAGFTYFDEPYPGSTSLQYHFKSAKNEYLRISVSSKLRDDAFQNVLLMTGKFNDDVFKIDPNAGPSNVVIKVNLDDNNE